jgi:hypothetical protein
VSRTGVFDTCAIAGNGLAIIAIISHAITRADTERGVVIMGNILR